MKKTFTIAALAAMLASSTVFALESYDPLVFTNNLRDCNVYATSDDDHKKFIKGWRAGKCIYVEKDNYGQTTNCTFNKEHIEELADTIRNFGYSDQRITLIYTNGDEDEFYSGSASIMDWTNYLNMPGVCYKE